MGYTITVKTIASACKTDPEWVFRTEVLCQWNEGATAGPFDPGAWDAGKVKTVRGSDGVERIANPDVDRIDGRVVAGIAQSGPVTYIALAGRRPDGLAQVEIVTGRYGTDWVGEWLTHPDRKGRIRCVTGQSRGAPEQTLMKKLKTDPAFRLPVVDLAGGDLLDAYADAEEAIRENTARHTPWPALDMAAATAEWKILAGGTKVLDPVKSPADIATLRAWVHALWLLDHEPPDAPPPPPPAEVIDLSSDDEYYGGGDVDFTSVQF